MADIDGGPTNSGKTGVRRRAGTGTLLLVGAVATVPTGFVFLILDAPWHWIAGAMAVAGLAMSLACLAHSAWARAA